MTEPPQTDELVLRTMAKAYPPIRIEEVTAESASALLTSDQPRRIELRVLAYGSSSEPPFDLDQASTQSIIKTAWVSPKEESPSDDGLTIAARRLAAWLDLAGSPGGHAADVEFRVRDQVIHRHALHWETAAVIAASPRMVVLQPGKGDCRVLVRSNDQKPFRITRIECGVPGMHVRAAGSAPALQQIVEVQGAPAPLSDVKRGLIAVFTDHPRQVKVDVPFTVLE